MPTSGHSQYVALDKNPPGINKIISTLESQLATIQYKKSMRHVVIIGTSQEYRRKNFCSKLRSENKNRLTTTVRLARLIHRH